MNNPYLSIVLQEALRGDDTNSLDRVCGACQSPNPPLFIPKWLSVVTKHPRTRVRTGDTSARVCILGEPNHLAAYLPLIMETTMQCVREGRVCFVVCEVALAIRRSRVPACFLGEEGHD